MEDCYYYSYDEMSPDEHAKAVSYHSALLRIVSQKKSKRFKSLAVEHAKEARLHRRLRREKLRLKQKA